MSNENPAVESTHSIGKQLRSAREQWGFSIDDIAGTLNLGVDTISALEADNYEALPSATFAKGYLRSYVRLLKLDEQALLEQFGEAKPIAQEVPTDRIAMRLKGRTTKPKRRSMFGGLFRLLIICAVIFGIITVLQQQKLLSLNGLSDWLQSNDGNNNRSETQQTEPNQPADNGERLGNSGIRIE